MFQQMNIEILQMIEELNRFEKKYSLEPIAKRLHTLLKQDIKMAPSVICEETLNMAKELKTGEILLLENMRFEEGSFYGRCLYK